MLEKRERQLILVRHAHRDTQNPVLDNGLSEKGRRQAEWIKRYFLSRWEHEKLSEFRFLTSPKRRCVETLEPLACSLKVNLEVDHLLGESDRGPLSLEQKVSEFTVRFEQGEGDWVCSSHGDWIPEWTNQFLGAPLAIKKSGVMVFRRSFPGDFRLVEFVSLWRGFSRLFKDNES